MKREWKLRREFQERPDAQQRWDRAFQHLLLWVVADAAGPNPWSPPVAHPSQEGQDEDRDLCESFDLAPSSSAVH